jgi:hypothetical protein
MQTQKRMKGDLEAGEKLGGGAANITGFFSGTNSVGGDTKCLQCLKRNHNL